MAYKFKKIGQRFRRFFFAYFIPVLILINVIIIILGTDLSMQEYFEIFKWYSNTVLVIFTCEYFLRVWLAYKADKNYIFSFIGLIDFFSIFPGWLPTSLGVNFTYFKLIRVVRMLNLFFFSRYKNTFDILQVVLKKNWELLVFCWVLISGIVVIASIIMYFVEYPAQPEVFSSVMMSMWWSVTTFTTIGYGDMYPITPLGRILASFLSIFGIGVFTIPVGIISAGFVTEYRERADKKKTNKRK